jgi:hypothetical protein
VIIDNDNHLGGVREDEVYLALPLYFFSFHFFTVRGGDKRGKKERFVVLNKTARLKIAKRARVLARRISLGLAGLLAQTKEGILRATPEAGKLY